MMSFIALVIFAAPTFMMGGLAVKDAFDTYTS
jgi:hypothetical protein